MCKSVCFQMDVVWICLGPYICLTGALTWWCHWLCALLKHKPFWSDQLVWFGQGLCTLKTSSRARACVRASMREDGGRYREHACITHRTVIKWKMFCKTTRFKERVMSSDELTHFSETNSLNFLLTFDLLSFGGSRETEKVMNFPMNFNI